ncbi:MAG: RNA polymerase sigma factor, partial [Myxococcota bacterium]
RQTAAAGATFGSVETPSERNPDPTTPAVRGPRERFEQLARPHIPKLRAVIRRLVAHPDDVDDLTQDSLLQAFDRITSFRGESEFSTWLCAIGARRALDHLRKKKRWRVHAQLAAEVACRTDPAKAQQLETVAQGPGHSFDVNEHIAFCFVCVARSLPPDQLGAVILRDVGGYSTHEAAKVLGVSRSVLRHRLAAARTHMKESFDGLCTLVSKRGACWQCRSLRDAHAPERRGPPPPELGHRSGDRDSYRRRLRIVRDADIDEGHAQALHDLAWRWLEAAEESRRPGD